MWTELLRAAPAAWRLLVGLLVIDLVFVAIFVFYGIQQVVSANPQKFPQLWSLAADYSMPEFFGYAKLLVSVACLFLAFHKTRQLIWCSWAVIFLLMFLDDALRVRELVGEWLAGLIPYSSYAGIEMHHYGELAVSVLLGSIALAFLVVGLSRSPATAIMKSGFFLIVAIGLVVCGIGIDLISSASYFQDTETGTAFSKTLYGALIIVEDGGEAFFMTLGCAGACAVWLAARRIL